MWAGIAASIKNVGDTRPEILLTNAENPTKEPLPGYMKSDADGLLGNLSCRRFQDMTTCVRHRKSLLLNDASLSFEPEVSAALGFGFRLRVSGPVAYGDYSGAAGAGV